MKYIITENRMLKIVEKLIKSIAPHFNFEDCKAHDVSNMDEKIIEYYSPIDKKVYAKYFTWTKELQLRREIFDTLENFIGEENSSYIIDWFNKEFGEDAETFTT